MPGGSLASSPVPGPPPAAPGPHRVPAAPPGLTSAGPPARRHRGSSAAAGPAPPRPGSARHGAALGGCPPRAGPGRGRGRGLGRGEVAGDGSRSTESLPRRHGDASEPSLSCPRVTEPSWRCSGVALELLLELPQGPGAVPELLRSRPRALELPRSCPGAIPGDAPEPWSAPQALPTRPEQKVMALGTKICVLVSLEQRTPSARVIKGTEEDAGGKSARL